MKEPLVSIIIPIYSVSKYLDRCVRSACDQTYRNIEIILVDDGSPDDCPAKCDAWAAADSRIRVIHKANGGLSDARNAGLDAARGKYVYFLDGDDFIKPELVATVVGYMEKGADLVAFHFDCVYPDGTVKPSRYHEVGKFDISPDNRLPFIAGKLLAEKIGWEAWSRMYSRELIEKYHLRFADNRRIFAEDLCFCLCYCAHAKQVISIANGLYCYVQRDNSIMGTDGGEWNVGRFCELSKEVLVHLHKWDECKDLTEHFPAIYYFIMNHILAKAVARVKVPPRNLRIILLNDISDWQFFAEQMRKALKNVKLLRHLAADPIHNEWISLVRYFVDGDYTALRIRNRMIYFFLGVERRTWHSRRLSALYRGLQREKKRVFLLGTEEFGNVGDHEINEATVRFLCQTLPGYTVHEVTAREWKYHKRYLTRIIRSTDIIVMAGGGNFGDAYPVAQNIRNEIIRIWPRNAKVVFPQTIHFSETPAGAEALKEAQLLYTKENRVTLFARERVSYQLAKNQFSCDVFMVPDIVLSSATGRKCRREDKILLCLRSDREKMLDESANIKLEQICRETGCAVEQTDLQLDCSVDRVHRGFVTDSSFCQWGSAKVVVTDRLHGMIFAAITGTPCIALSNYNHKVAGAYEWIRYLSYIRFAETVEDVQKILPQLLAMENCTYDNTPLMPYFEKLTQVVREYAGDQCNCSGLQG